MANTKGSLLSKAELIQLKEIVSYCGSQAKAAEWLSMGPQAVCTMLSKKTRPFSPRTKERIAQLHLQLLGPKEESVKEESVKESIQHLMLAASVKELNRKLDLILKALGLS